MISLYSWKMPSIVLAVAAISCFATSEKLVAAPPNVTYTGTGTFTSLISGNDLLDLNGEPFTFSVVANVGAVPKKYGTYWAAYAPLQMTLTVSSGLLPTPITLTNQSTTLLLATGTNSDLLEVFTPIPLPSGNLTITAKVVMPLNTITKLHPYPFPAPVAMTPATATVTYSDGTNSTTLGITGTLNAPIPGGGAVETATIQ